MDGGRGGDMYCSVCERSIERERERARERER